MELAIGLMREMRKALGEGGAVVLVGAAYDQKMGDPVANALAELGYTVVNYIGQTTAGQLVEVVKGMDYLVSYPSGVGIVADVVDVPDTMFFPEKLRPVIPLYADPGNVQSKRHLNLPFMNVPEALELIVQQGLPHAGMEV